jgi:hypothetical protein
LPLAGVRGQGRRDIGSRNEKELAMLTLAALSHWILAAGTGNQTPLVVGALAIILIAGIAAAISLKKS